ncbi:MAG: FHA domain-containing protein [Lachnospiraceae bacterium]
MKKVSFRVRNFDKEQFLTYNIDNEADLDDDVLDFIEDEEPSGIVPIIFDDEEEDYDTFSYDVTDKIQLTELSNQEINAEMVLMVMRGIVVSLSNMAEYRIPLSYLVLHRNYIYIDSDYKVEFICIPLEDMQEDVDICSFLRGFLSGLRFDPADNGDYVAKLFTYINNPAIFTLHNLLALVEELMEDYGIEIPDDNETGIYVDYQEVEEPEVEDSESLEELEAAVGETSLLREEEEENVIHDIDDVEPLPDVSDESLDDAVVTEDAKEIIDKIKQQVMEEKAVTEDVISEDETEEPEDVVSEEETEGPDEVVSGEEAEEPDEAMSEEEPEKVVEKKKTSFKTKEPTVTGVVIHDELDDYLAEKEEEEKKRHKEESGIKMKKAIKVNRASIVKNNQEEQKTQEEAESSSEEEISGSILSQSIGATGVLNSASAVPKANPYLIRVNTDDRIMITKQTFKIGKASMGVDYTVQGNGAVSRVHAIITSKDGVYYIKDNKSTNHTYVNGKILDEGDEELLTHDSKIMLGNEEFIFKLR